MPVAQRTAQAVIEALARIGLDAGRLGVPRVEDDQSLAALLTRAIARTGRRTLPLELGIAMPLGVMGVVDYLAAASATVGAALVVAQQVFPRVAPGVQLCLERLRRREHRVVVMDQPPFPGQAESDLLVLGILLGRLRLLASRPLDIPLIELTEMDGSRARWAQLLKVPRIRFGARRTALQLSPSDWAVPMRNADPLLLEMLRSMVGTEHRSADALLVAMRSLARERLPAQLTLDDAAVSLGMSRRTLQRKLAISGTTLSKIADESRRDRSEELVGEGLLTMGEVAARVGFGEQASFTRAWRRWFGAAPSRRRRGCLGVSRRRCSRRARRPLRYGGPFRDP